MDKIDANKTYDFTLFKRVMSYVKPYKGIFFSTSFFAILLSFLSPARPLLIQYAFDNFILIPNLPKLKQITFLLVFILTIESIVQFFYTYWANYLGQVVIKDIRLQVYNKILKFKHNAATILKSMSKTEIRFPLIIGKIKNVNVRAKPRCMARAGKPLNIPKLNQKGKGEAYQS